MKIAFVAFLSLLLYVTAAFGQADGAGRNGQMVTNLFEVKNRLEKEVQQNLINLISTQLNPDTFTVSARMTLVPAPPPDKKPDAKTKESGPPGLDLGVISAKELSESYERQIEELKLKKENINKSENPNFQITKIDIIVGLDPSLYDDAYFKKFEKWIAETLSREFGGIARFTVTKLPKRVDDPFQPKYLALPLAAGLLSAALLLMGFLVLVGLRKVATATKLLEIKPQGELAIKGIGLPGPAQGANAENQLDSKQFNDANLIKNTDIDRLIKKIAFIVIEVGPRVSDLVRVWIDEGDEGYVKTALLIDTILAAQEKLLSEAGKMVPFQIPISDELAKTHEEALAQAYKSLIEMEDIEKFLLLEKIYWNLLSVRTLGLQSLRRPYDFLRSMSPENVIELLSTQRSESKALAIMHLPEEKRGEILSTLSDQERETVVQHALQQISISDRKIWDAETSLKVVTMNQSSNASERMVNLFPRTIEMLQSLNIIEEIRVLRKVTPELPDEGIGLKQQFVTLAFVDQWKPEYLSKLCSVSTADEIVNLIRTIPESKDCIIAGCTEKIKIIVMDDLKLPANEDAAKVRLKLESLRNKWNRICLTNQINMAKVIHHVTIKKVGSHEAA